MSFFLFGADHDTFTGLTARTLQQNFRQEVDSTSDFNPSKNYKYSFNGGKEKQMKEAIKNMRKEDDQIK